MRHLPLSFLIATLPSLALAETWSTPRKPNRTLALQLGAVFEYMEHVQAERSGRGASGLVELGGSIPVGYEENELFLLARVGGGAPGFSLSAHGGLRSVFGHEAWQTYVDLGAVIHARPDFGAGPRLGMGVRHALTETFSLYGGLGAQLLFGSGLRLDVELSSGVRWSL